RVIVSNKCDIGEQVRDGFLRVSAKTGAGLDVLRQELTRTLDVESSRDEPAITNLRHIILVEKAHEALLRAREAVGAVELLPEEFLLSDLQNARAALEEVSG